MVRFANPNEETKPTGRGESTQPNNGGDEPRVESSSRSIRRVPWIPYRNSATANEFPPTEKLATEKLAKSTRSRKRSENKLPAMRNDKRDNDFEISASENLQLGKRLRRSLSNLKLMELCCKPSQTVFVFEDFFFQSDSKLSGKTISDGLGATKRLYTGFIEVVLFFLENLAGS